MKKQSKSQKVTGEKKELQSPSTSSTSASTGSTSKSTRLPIAPLPSVVSDQSAKTPKTGEKELDKPSSPPLSMISVAENNAIETTEEPNRANEPSMVSEEQSQASTLSASKESAPGSEYETITDSEAVTERSMR